MAKLIAEKHRKTGKPNGRWRITFNNGDGNRQEFRPGRMSAQSAQEWCDLIGRMEYSLKYNRPLAPSDQEWLDGLEGSILQKLVDVGLVTIATQTEPVTLAAFIDRYLERRVDIKPRTRINLLACRKELVDYFGADKRLAEILPGHADEWRLHLMSTRKPRKLGENTIRRLSGRARQLFRVAERKGLIAKDSNPFAGLPSTVRENAERFYFVTRREAAAVLDACPDDPEWQLIFALARYGGLRCPSEVLSLKWDHVNWEHNRLIVPQPKLEHLEGRETRLVPIFPELRPYLDRAFDKAPRAAGQPGPSRTAFVITKYRDSETNLRTRLHKIIIAAGLKPWPKAFQNLRSTRQTELAETFPNHVVCDWIGNSEAVAKRHYLQVTDEHFARAIAGSTEAAKGEDKGEENSPRFSHSEAAQGGVFSAHAEEGALKNPAKSGVFPELESGGYPQGESKKLAKHGESHLAGPISHTLQEFSDPWLERLAAAWPNQSAATKAAIKAAVLALAGVPVD